MLHTLSLYALGAMFIAAGVGHFVKPAFFEAIVPPYLPAPRLLVYASGIAEIAGGMGVLLPEWRTLAGWGLIALLVVFFLPHIYMARHPEQFERIPVWALYLRLAMQFVLIAWVYWTAC